MRQGTLYIGESDLGSKSERGIGVFVRNFLEVGQKSLNLGALVMKGGLGTNPIYAKYIPIYAK